MDILSAMGNNADDWMSAFRNVEVVEVKGRSRSMNCEHVRQKIPLQIKQKYTTKSLFIGGQNIHILTAPALNI